MNAVTISQNRSNGWTGFGVLIAVGLLIVSGVGMIVSWPIEVSFEWILLPILFLGALVLGGNYLYWLVTPRNAVFSVSADQICIEDQPVFRWITRTFSPSEVVEISYSSESGSRLKTKDGRSYVLSDILMMQRGVIFSAISAEHPHIALKENN